VRFPSIDLLARQALAVFHRFPLTLAAGALAAFAGIQGSLSGADEPWVRLVFVAALGLPLTMALALLGESRGWSDGKRHLVVLGGLLGLAAFYLIWPGPERRHEAIRYVQLSTALHLGVAFLPFLGVSETVAFWQYNRRLFLGFLRAGLFSGVLYGGVTIALAALDKLFGVHVASETYFRIWFVFAFLVNTWIFLAVVPERLDELEHDREYPRALKIFAQYILTPLVFTYLVILLAYLVKIVAGGEWPSGWIGWLVASVSVTGLLGFLLVHPLRTDPAESWIRTYSRWLFIGLIPAALMLLVAFWKRILPYGLTEPRLLGVVLGLWLLGIAVLFTIRSATGIRIIPVTLAAVLLLMLYGPGSLTRLSVSSQARRLARMLQPSTPAQVQAREGSAALRFLMDHNAGDAIATAIGREVPPVNWARVPRYGTERDSLARMVMELAGARYVPEYAGGPEGWFHLSSGGPIPVAGYAWAVPAGANDATKRVVDNDTVQVVPQSGGNGRVLVRVGKDTLLFDLRPVVQRYADSMPPPTGTIVERIAIDAEGGHRARLVITNLSGQRGGDTLINVFWGGNLLLGE
jgi:uncharacterized protein DUF4153